eukprot:CAMPEP_0174296284 /NCGR_PEP_ID=MMETSP0809-20121228/47387_1 /TAXON_ID=73025 ORGANISM="Eutreptiella gymnastica-like, Strain CCMP1594" /NCGR_SAMPLE_ID=MMETSP0809 /ASSEMBLY_ACC=CAM_ASM_000658 /LENGTH=117 /DNA_ID=CAMNT_0015399163 /DNA_START=226 /DNA_END=575 /DNA_ORIENTATION=-
MPLRCETKDPSSNPGPGSNPRWVRSDVPGPGACCLRPKGIHGHDGNESSVIVKSRDRRPRLPPEAELSARPSGSLAMEVGTIAAKRGCQGNNPPFRGHAAVAQEHVPQPLQEDCLGL